jgi:hypothetical protein
MPCYDTRASEDRERNIERLHEATRVACWALRVLEIERQNSAEYIRAIRVPEYVSKWWEEHCKDDAARAK